MLNCYVGRETELLETDRYPQSVSQTVAHREVTRYSSTQESRIKLRGITGEMLLDDMPEECLEWLLAGELTHIGKNTSFGFGKYTLLSRASTEH